MSVTTQSVQSVSVCIPVILCGGTGSRLWPLSRESLPKQLLALTSDKTLLQETVLRAQAVSTVAPIIICNAEYRFLIAAQLQAIGVQPLAILLEPCAKNTAPAVALAALYAKQWAEKNNLVAPALFIMPADHVLEAPIASLQAQVQLAVKRAASGNLVTFGVVPTYPATGYGYIKAGSVSEAGVFQVASFKEKPDAKTAEQYIATGEYFWNAGLFILSPDCYLTELAAYRPAILQAIEHAYADMTEDLDFLRLPMAAFSQVPAESIDYAVMEATQHAEVIPLQAKWHDIGAWDALMSVLPEDEAGNCLRGDVIAEEVQASYIHASSRLVAALGVKDLVVVETPDAVLVAEKSRCQDVKQLVTVLQAKGRTEVSHHRCVYRPWGEYETVCASQRFQVKRIIVKPGAMLSMQKHYHRSEHWVVVKGTAEVTCGERVFLLSENQSTYIPQTEKHRLRNVGKIPLEIIEVQVGSYLGEDDIERFDDIYGRVIEAC